MSNPNRPNLARRALVLTAMALAAALALAACGGGSSSTSTASGEASTVSEGGGKEEVSVALEQVYGTKFTQLIDQGAHAAADEVGPVDLTISGPHNGPDATEAQQQANDLLSQHPDAMAVSPFPPELWHRTLQSIVEQVPNSLAFTIKPVETPDQAESSLLKTFVGVDEHEVAAKAMEELIAAAELGPQTTGTAVIGQCFPGSSGTLYERTVGFEDVLKEELPKVKIDVFNSKPEPQENTNAWEAKLQAEPNPVLAIGTCEQDGESLVRLTSSSGASFPIGSLEFPPAVVKGLQDGTVLAAVGVNWWLEGYVTTRLLAEAARGEELPEGFVDVGYTVVNEENIAEIEERDDSEAGAQAWYGPKVEEFFEDVEAHVSPLADAWK